MDEETAARYRRMKGAIGDEIRKKLVSDGEENYFPLENGRCPFLNAEGLCRIILEKGEDALCDLCREHPRFYNWYGDWTEAGLGLSCEEAERLLFSSEEPVPFLEWEEGEQPCDGDEDGDLPEVMMTARSAAISLMQCRAIPFGQRLIRLSEFGRRLQDLMDADDLQGIVALAGETAGHGGAGKTAPERREPAAGAGETAGQDSAGNTVPERRGPAAGAGETAGCGGAGNIAPERRGPAADADNEAEKYLRGITDVYRQISIQEKRWKGLLEEIRCGLKTITANASSFAEAFPETEIEYEHLAVYFLYRYFLESLHDYDIRSKTGFVAASLFMIRMGEILRYAQTGSRTAGSRDALIRLYSREIEYCPENMEALMDLPAEGQELGSTGAYTAAGVLFGGL